MPLRSERSVAILAQESAQAHCALSALAAPTLRWPALVLPTSGKRISISSCRKIRGVHQLQRSAPLRSWPTIGQKLTSIWPRGKARCDQPRIRPTPQK
mmetsp:Transcript_13398/g.10708  ORF Transcript_13398/g.10708 Transcript_13398/m.10708 type:complete len:98 (+) Transcript_13398:340-633(+)